MVYQENIRGNSEKIHEYFETSPMKKYMKVGNVMALAKKNQKKLKIHYSKNIKRTLEENEIYFMAIQTGVPGKFQEIFKKNLKTNSKE